MARQRTGSLPPVGQTTLESPRGRPSPVDVGAIVHPDPSALSTDLAEHLPEAVLLVDRTGQILWANTVARQMGAPIGGRLAEEARRWAVRDLDGRSLASFTAVVHETIFAGVPQTVVVTTPAGEERLLHVQGRPLPDGQRCLISVRDITHSISSHPRRVMLARAALAMVQTLDLDAVLIRLAGLARDLLGARALLVFLADDATRQLRCRLAVEIPPEVWAGVAVVPYDAPCLSARAARTRQAQFVGDLSTVAPDAAASERLAAAVGGQAALALPLVVSERLVGVLLVIAASPVVLSENRLDLEFLASFCAIAVANAQAYAAEARARAMAEAVWRAVPVGLLVLDSEGRVQQANPVLEAFLGQPLRAGAPWPPAPDALRQADGAPLAPAEWPWIRCQAGADVVTGEYLLVPPGSPARPVRVIAAPLTVGGHPQGTVLAWVDLTAERELERLRDEWMAVITHEMRNPLQVIVGFAASLQRDLEGAQTRLGYIARAAQQLRRMVGDLQSLARIETGQLALEPVVVDDLAGVVRTILDRLAITVSQPLRLQAEGPLPAVRVDLQRLEQILSNLVTNAAKYGAPDQPITVTLTGRADGAVVAVTNWGPGIPPEELPHLFQRFWRGGQAWQSGRQGLGLGLYIARRLVEAHGGTIWAESTPGQTTTFHFTLPAAG